MTRSCRFAAFILVFLLTSCFALAQQYPGQNINMVSGTVWPAGDPYLQRQNEPSMAVSSRNGQHLMAGANDYRTVDIPNPQAPNILGDAWLGVYSSLDGGDTWKSTLLPGYPQDTSSVGTSSPLHQYTVATDPTVRAGTHGLFYYSGLAFNRGTGGASAVFVAMFQDMNNKGNGDNAILTKDANGKVHGNPIQYLGVSLVDSGNTGQFLDKPWVAVDIPRAGRTATCKVNGQTISSGYAYIVYTQFNGSQNNPSSKIKASVSTNCGATWSQPQVLSQSMKLAQGTVASIDPTTGNVIVAWRQIASSNGSQPDAIQWAVSTNGGNSYTNYPAAYTFAAASASYPQGSVFDQPATSSTSTTFRTLDVPALAVDGSGRAWLAFSMRVNGPKGEGTYGSRIMVQTLAPGAKSWSAAYQADSSLPLTKDGHQFMPSFSFAYGKLALAWFDSRRDNMQSIVSCPGGNCSNFAGGTIMDVPIPNGALDPNTKLGRAAVFTPTITDPTSGVRHTVDIFGAVIDPSTGSNPKFPAFQISQYPYYVNDNPSDVELEQGFFNPPNLPMFVQGTTPFIGDYIDIAGQGIIPSGNTWAFNTQGSDPKTGATIAPDFHITWTDNRDVVPPPVVSGKQDWTQYVPPNSGSSSTSTYSGSGGACPTCQTTQPACTTTTDDNNATASYSGDRNQNVYTSRLSNGLLVQFKENAKTPNAGVPQRSFSLLVRNTVPPLSTSPPDSPSFFRVMLGVTSNTQTPVCNNASIAGSTNPCYIDLEIYPDTTQTPQIVVNSAGSVNVLVAQIQAIPPAGTQPTFLPLQALAVINGDPSNPAVVDADTVVPDDSNPDIETQYPGNLIASGEEYYPTVDGPPDPTPENPDPSATVGFPAVYTPLTGTSTNSSPAVTVNTPKINTPKINTPKIASVQIANPKIVDTINTPKITTINTPKINTPKIAAPEIFSPKITNLSDNNGLTDYTWKVNNKGNTSSSYSTSEFVKSSGVTCCSAACSANPNACTPGCSVCQLIQHKVYESPVSNRDASNFNATCDLTVQQFSITVANIPDPAFGTDPSGTIGTGGTSTLSLSPGEGNRVTLRVVGPPVGQGQPVSPFKTQATSFSANTGQAQPSGSLLFTTTALPVAVVGQPYLGAQLTATGGTGSLAFSVPNNIDNPVAATLPIPTQPLPVTPLTFNQAGQITTGVVTASPDTYLTDLQVQDAAPTPALDVQQLSMLVNQFSISVVDVNIANTVGSQSYMQSGDQATVTVSVLNQGPATATGVTVNLQPNPTAGGNPSGPLPVMTCTGPVGNATIQPNSTGNYAFTCTAGSGNGYVNFTASASGQYANAPAATVTATTAHVTEPMGTTQSPNVIVDNVVPTVTFNAPTPQANANGWNNTNVTFTYTTNDNLSGVFSLMPNPLVISTEGAAVTGHVTATDYAKNTYVYTSTPPIKLDKTPPTVQATSSYTPGVYTNQNVTVVFTCNDALSGPAGAPVVTSVPTGATVTPNGFGTTVVLTAETTGTTLQSTCQDLAGNTSLQTSFGPILIDKTPPVLTVGAVTTHGGGTPYAAGTWTNGNVTVTFSCADNASPVGANSGVAAPPTGNTIFTTETSNGTTTGMCMDVAGNVSSLPFGPVQIDKTPPVLTVLASTPSGAYTAGTWTNQPVTVNYTCTDTAGPANSGVAANNPMGSQTFTTETSSGSATGTCTDVAGNSAAALPFGPVQIDLTPPTVTMSANLGSSTGPAYTAGTWTNQSVVVSVACTDSLSGVKAGSIMGNTTESAQGTYTANGSCMDNAGNTGNGSFGQILIDTTTPTAVIASPQGQAYILNSQITPNFTCSDGSGGDATATCTGTPSSGPYTATPVGPSTFSVHVVDQAGNASSPDPSVSYLVVYNFTGFQAPLQQAVFMNAPNPATPPQPSDSGSITTGTMVPIAWQLQDATNAYIKNLSSLVSIVAIANANCAGSATGTSTTLYNGTIGASSLSYDNPNKRFVFNWDTTSFATGCYNLVLTTDDTAQYSTIVHIAADTFVGFDTPLTTASAPASPSNSGSFDTGATIPLMWQLQLPNGSLDTAGTNLQNVSAFANATCSGAPPTGSAKTVIYDLATTTGSFNFEPSTAVYTVNWATGSAAPGCYDIFVTLADQSVYTTMVTLANQGAPTTVVQYNFDNVPQGSASQTAAASYAAPGIVAGSFGFTGNNANGMFTNGCDIALCIDPSGVQSGDAYTFSFTNSTAISQATISFWAFNNDCQVNPSGCPNESFSVQYDTSSTFSNPVTIGTFTPNEPGLQKSNSFPISGTLPTGTYYFRILATGTENDATAQYVFDDVTITGVH